MITALIAAVSACIGALIPCLFSYLGKKKDYEINRNARLEEIRRKEYSDYIQSLQNMINNGDRENFLSMQASTNRLLLFSGPELSQLVNQYYDQLVSRTIQKRPLSLEEQTTFQTNILNAMRAELGIAGEKLRKVSLVRATF